MIVVSDTSILSALAEINQTHLLPALFIEVVITRAVHDECLHRLAPLSLRELVAHLPSWLVVVDLRTPLIRATDCLDPGEASSITFALSNNQTLLLIDELKGRAVARRLGIQITGLIGFLGRAALRDLIDFEEVVSHLNKTRFRVSEAIIDQVRLHLTRIRDEDHS